MWMPALFSMLVLSSYVSNTAEKIKPHATCFADLVRAAPTESTPGVCHYAPPSGSFMFFLHDRTADHHATSCIGGLPLLRNPAWSATE